MHERIGGVPRIDGTTMTTLTESERARLGQVAMKAFWRMQLPPDALTKAEVAERWQEAASAVVEAVREEESVVVSCDKVTD